VFVVVLIGQRAGDLLQINAAQVKHQARIGLLTASLQARNARSAAMSVKRTQSPEGWPPTIWMVIENYLVLVRSSAGEQRWPLTTSRSGRDWLLAITSPDGKSWAAEGPDLFKALQALRRILDPLDIRLGVNGARTDAWASGMQCDMGEGRVVYLLVGGQAGRPEQVSTLGSAPISHVGTVEDQDQQHEQWLRSRRTVN